MAVGKQFLVYGFQVYVLCVCVCTFGEEEGDKHLCVPSNRLTAWVFHVFVDSFWKFKGMNFGFERKKEKYKYPYTHTLRRERES